MNGGALRDGDRLAELLVPGTVDVVSVIEAMLGVDLGEPMRTS